MPPPGRASNHTAAPCGLAVRRRDLPGFQQLFETPQVLSDLRLRILPQQPGEGRGEPAADRAVMDAEPDDRAAALRGGLENHRAGVRNLRAVERAPRERCSGPVLRDLAIPL